MSEDAVRYTTNVDEDVCSMTTSIVKACEHKNGWYGNVKVLIFYRTFFLCSDCGHMKWKSRWRIF